MPGVSMCATDIAIGGTAGISGCGAAFKVDGLLSLCCREPSRQTKVASVE